MKPCRNRYLAIRIGQLASLVALVPFVDVKAQESKSPTFIERTAAQANQLSPLTKSDLGRQFLNATEMLPNGESRTIYRHAQSKQYVSETVWTGLDPSDRAQMKPTKVGKWKFYTTKYGTPLAYTRALDLVGSAGLKSVHGRKVLDVGYGGIGHLRVLALMGADAVGVDVDSYLTALYSHEEDQGPLRVDGKTRGRVGLVDGRWPADAKTKQSIGSGYDLILSKNTLKRGYIHPEKSVEARFTIQLGVDDETYCRSMYGILRPGGFVMIYNISPPPNTPDKPYIPWADGRCPFDRELLEQLGFNVLAYNVEDNAAIRAMGRELGWGKNGGDLETFFARYTLLRKNPSKEAGGDQ